MAHAKTRYLKPSVNPFFFVFGNHMTRDIILAHTEPSQCSAYHNAAASTVGRLTDVHQIMMILPSLSHQMVNETSDDQHQEKNGDLFWNL